MGYNFPTTPSLGQSYTSPDGKIYVWNGYAWAQTPQAGPIPVGVIISDTPPTGVEHGALWWDSDSGNTFIYFDDGSSKQWVQFNIAPPIAPPDYPSGIFKISEGELVANAAAVEIPVPTTGFKALELVLSNICLTLVGGVFAQVSYDNGTSYIGGAAAYYYAYDGVGSTPPGGWAQSGGTTNVVFIMPSCGASASVRALAKLSWNLNDAIHFPQFMADSVGYTGTEYRRYRCSGSPSGSGGQSGMPNKLKIFSGGGVSLLAGFKWQLNGVR